MFRKIHSNRDPRDTLYSELRREFGSYIEKGAGKARALCDTRPRAVFSGMLILLLLSAALSFTIFRHPAPKTPPKVNALKTGVKQPSLNEGFDRILATGTALQQTLHLKSEVESLLGKGKLNHTDSLALESALDSLGQIHHQINNAP